MPPYAPQDSGSGTRLEFRTTLLVLLAALGITYLPPSTQEAMAASLRGTVLRPFLAMQEGLVRARARAEEAEVLQARIDSLTAIAMGRTTLEEENRRLRGLLDLSVRLGPEWRPVQVLRPGTSDSESMFIVDAGVEQGVNPRAPLLTREGLAGVIRESYADQAVGMDWTHPDFRASAMTVDGLQFGMVRSARGLFPQDVRLLFEGLPYYAQVDSGTVVVTSGVGVLPRGLPIGRVVALEEAEGGWRKSFRLQPFVEVASVTLALVGLEGLRPQEDLAPAWGENGFLRAEEWVARQEALEDSIQALRDSLAVLQNRRGLPEEAGR